jgi:Fe-S oxidoreductase
MLDRAQTLLLQILDELSPEIEAGIPMVGLEPSCVAVFRDELLNLFPHDKRAQALARQTFLLSEFLETTLRISLCRSSTARRSSTAIATINP